MTEKIRITIHICIKSKRHLYCDSGNKRPGQQDQNRPVKILFFLQRNTIAAAMTRDTTYSLVTLNVVRPLPVTYASGNKPLKISSSSVSVMLEYTMKTGTAFSFLSMKNGAASSEIPCRYRPAIQIWVGRLAPLISKTPCPCNSGYESDPGTRQRDRRYL